MLLTILILIGLMFGYVVYQSQDAKGDFNIYVRRFNRLMMTALAFIKDVAVEAVSKFRKVDWSLETQQAQAQQKR